MKKSIITLLVAFLMIVICVPFEKVRAADSIKLSKSKVSIQQGEQITLKLEGVSAKAKVKWSVSKKNIVALENKKKSDCKVVAQKEGTTYVKAKYNGKTYKCKVTVTKVKGKSESSDEVKTTLTIYERGYNTYYTMDGEYTGELSYGVPNGRGTFTGILVQGIDAIEVKTTVEGSFNAGKINGWCDIYYYDSTTGEAYCREEAYYEEGEFIKCSIEGDDYSSYYAHIGDKVYEKFTFDGTTSIFHTTFGDGTWTTSQDADVIYNMGFYALQDNLSLEELAYINSTLQYSHSKIKKEASTIDPKKFKKNPKTYENSIGVISNAYVFDCKEYDTDNKNVPTVTLLYCEDDSGQIYVLVYPNSVDVYEGDYVNVWFTLTGEYYYESVSQKTIISFAGIAYITEKSK